MAQIGARTYTGEAIKPEVAISFGGKVLKAGRDYEVSYANNVEVGTATVTTAGQGNFDCSVTLDFEIADEVDPDPDPEPETPTTESVPMYRLYNAATSEHFYTASASERDTLVAKHGWKAEGIGWYGVKG